MNWWPKRKNKGGAFWDWFAANQKAYLQLEESTKNKRLTQLQKKLQKVNQHLTFELGELDEANSRPLIISADGMVEVFEEVTTLVAQAPELDSFSVIAFRQQQQEEASIEYEDIKLSWRDIFYEVDQQAQREELNLILYIRGFSDEQEDEFVTATFILLDTVIGEYNVGMHIGEIEFRSYEGQPHLLPIKELPNHF